MSTLTDRYIYATTRTLHGSGRDDVGEELRAEIDGMIAARVADGAAFNEAERASLADLGDPERLAASYAGRPLQLIGPAYFLAWKRLLIVLLTWIPVTLAFIVVGSELLDGEGLGEAVGHGLDAAYGIAIQIVFWTTLTFALIDRYADASDAPEWTLDALPELPAPSRPSLSDTVGEVGSNAAAILLLVWQEQRGVLETASGGRVPVIDSDLWSTWMPLVLAAFVIQAVVAVVAYRRVRWTLPLAVSNAAAQLAFAIPTVWLLVEDKLIDPRFIAEVDWLQEGNHLHNAALAVAAVVVLTVAIDVASKFRAAVRAR